MNTWLIADEREAYVLESVKSWWAWKKITDHWSISNVLSLEKDFDAVSPGLVENAVKKGWCKSASDFNLRKCYSDPVITWGAAGKGRQACSRDNLALKKGDLTTADFMDILRHHGGREDFRPHKHGGTVCMHAADKLIRRSQSVASMVGNVGGLGHYYYVTGASNPCLSPFFPVFAPGTVSPAGYLEGGAEYSPEVYWWESEKIHRRALRHFPAALKSAQQKIQEHESDMLRAIEEKHVSLNQAAIDSYFGRARRIVDEWGAQLEALPKIKHDWFFQRYWQGYHKLNGTG